MSADLQNPIFNDETKAREALEATVWPNGRVCPHCGNVDQDKIAKAQGKAARPGLYYCAACNGQFTGHCRHGFRAFQNPADQMVAGNASAWNFQEGHERASASSLAWRDLQDRLVHGASHPRGHDRPRSRPDGRRRQNCGNRRNGFRNGRRRSQVNQQNGRALRYRRSLTLVERGGAARSFHVDGTTIAELKPIIRANVARETAIMTDQAAGIRRSPQSSPVTTR